MWVDSDLGPGQTRPLPHSPKPQIVVMEKPLTWCCPEFFVSLASPVQWAQGPALLLGLNFPLLLQQGHSPAQVCLQGLVC